jgi:hypothetical protein
MGAPVDVVASPATTLNAPPAAVPDPADRTIAPPVSAVAVVRPELSVNAPPLPEDDVPTNTDTEPLEPPVAFPVPMTTPPVLLDLAAPLLRIKLPLTPRAAGPAFCVRMSTSPLDVLPAPPVPLVMNRFPPRTLPIPDDSTIVPPVDDVPDAIPPLISINPAVDVLPDVLPPLTDTAAAFPLALPTTTLTVPA